MSSISCKNFTFFDDFLKITINCLIKSETIHINCNIYSKYLKISPYVYIIV
jgi:hypothetical protein